MEETSPSITLGCQVSFTNEVTFPSVGIQFDFYYIHVVAKMVTAAADEIDGDFCYLQIIQPTCSVGRSYCHSDQGTIGNINRSMRSWGMNWYVGM